MYGLPCSSVGKESICNAGNPGWIPGLGRSAGEGIDYSFQYSWAFLVAQLVKNPPAMQETWLQSLGWEDPLEKGKATHSWPGESHGLQSMGSQRIGHNWATFTSTSYLWDANIFVSIDCEESKTLNGLCTTDTVIKRRHFRVQQT